MLATIRWTLRQRRYVRILALMAVVAAGCVAMGTFETHRYLDKRRTNAALVAAAQAAPTALTTRLVGLVSPAAPGRGPAPSLRQVTATGRYQDAATAYVQGVTQDGRQGYYVVTPLRVAGAGELLVARGFVPVRDGSEQPQSVPPAPAGAVTVTGRLQAGSDRDDRFGAGGVGGTGGAGGTGGTARMTGINPVRAAARLGSPVFASWLSLADSAPGSDGLSALPAPDLSNPSGGASQWQLASYVVQWFAFALLALLAPFLFSRAELREARRRLLGVDEGAEQLDAVASPSPVAQLTAGASADAALVRRRTTEVSLADVPAEQLRRARRLADRYGTSLSTADSDRRRTGEPDLLAVPRRSDLPPVLRRPEPTGAQANAEAAQAPHRSPDDYHGSYNDYLWRLAMADGDLPTPEVAADPAAPRPVGGAGWVPERPTVIDAEAGDER